MAIALGITDGTTTLTLNSGGYQVERYIPVAPTADFRTINEESDGGELTAAHWRNLMETAVVNFGTPEDAVITRGQINTLFNQARYRQSNGAGPHVYVTYSHTNSYGNQRSEILWGVARSVNRNERSLEITWTRRYFWEGDEVAAQLNNDVSGTLAGNKTLYNHSRNANSRNNWVKFYEVLGDLPTPARLALLNNYASGTATSQFYLGHYCRNGNALSHMIEMEDGTNVGGSATISDGTASNSAYVNVRAAGTTEQIAWHADITQAQLQAAGGNLFRVLAYQRTGASEGDVQIKARLSTELISTWWDGQYVACPTISGTLLDLGLVQLPPRKMSQAAPYPLKLELRAKRTTTNSAATVPIDYIQLTPARSWRVMRDLGYSTAQNVTLHDQPAEGLLYTDGWSGGSIANYEAEGNPIMLVPGETNVVYLLVTPTDNILRSTNLSAWYRPRRLVI